MVRRIIESEPGKPGHGRSGVMRTHQTAAATKEPLGQSRYNELKQMLEGRRRELQAQVQGKMRDVRASGEVNKLTEVFDAGESSENDIQEDIELALIQMKAESSQAGSAALRRLPDRFSGCCFRT